MAITDTRPTMEPSVAETEPVIGLPGLDHGGIAGYLGTGDHKAIGRTYIAAALFFGFGALVLDALVSAHEAHGYLPASHVFQLYTLSRLGAVLLFAIPMFIGLATYVCPLQVGANAVAFPGWLRPRCGDGSSVRCCSARPTRSTAARTVAMCTPST